MEKWCICLMKAVSLNTYYIYSSYNEHVTNLHNNAINNVCSSIPQLASKSCSLILGLFVEHCIYIYLNIKYFIERRQYDERVVRNCVIYWKS